MISLSSRAYRFQSSDRRSSPGHVAAEIGKLDALPLPLAPPLALHPPAKHLARHQLQPLELGHQVGRQKCGFSDGHRQPDSTIMRLAWRQRRLHRSRHSGLRPSLAVTSAPPSLRLLRHLLQNLQQHLIRIDPFGLGLEVENHPMPHRRQEHSPHVFEAHVVPPAQQRPHLRRQRQRLRPRGLLPQRRY